jgi:hypothetical protein
MYPKTLAVMVGKTCEEKILGYEYRNSPFHCAAMYLNFWCGKHAVRERISKGLLKNLIPTPKDTTERQKMGIFGWSLEKAPLAPKFKFKSLCRN